MSFKAENFRMNGYILLAAKTYSAVFVYLVEKVPIIFLSPLNQENVAVFDSSTRSLLLPQSDVNGEVQDLKLTIINNNPLRFDLEILE